MNCSDIINKRKAIWDKDRDIEKDTTFVSSVAEYVLSKDGEIIRKELLEHPEYLIEMCFVIVNKDEETVPFFLNETQKKFLINFNQAKEDFNSGKRQHLNFLVLKGRQAGFTSFITAFQLAHSMLHKNFTGMTIADNAENSHTIFEDKAKYPYNNLPDAIKPTEKYNNRQEIHFEKLNSRWRVYTAGNREVGRSKTIRFLHASEAAFFDSIKKIMTGLGQSLTKKSIKILESTANGANEFEELWNEAKAGKNNWEPLFYEWWNTPEYRLPFMSERHKTTFIDTILSSGEKTIYGKIKWLIEYAGLDWEQANWYYDKYKELGEMLPQEYPNTPEEAFISSGTHIFDVDNLRKRKATLEKHYEENPPKRYTISYEYEPELQIILNDTIRLIENPKGELWIYEQPIQGYPYAIGCDIAEGGADSSCGTVINNITGNEAAVWHGKTDTDIFAKIMYCLGKMYNWALIAIENNFDKHPTKELQRLKYKNMYYRETIDSISKEKLQKFGFLTGMNTRPILIDKLIEIVRDNVESINHIEEINEMLSFIRNDRGKAEASSGKHDDLVMSRGITEMIRTQQKLSIEEVKEEISGHYHYKELEMLGYKKYQIKSMIKNGKVKLIGGLEYIS